MRPRWKLVGLFYAMALGWVTLVAVGLVAFGAGDLGIGAKKVAQLVLAFLYMPAPLVAALVTERIAGDRPLIRFTFQGFGRKALRLGLVVVTAMPVWFLLSVVLVYLLGNVAHVPGVGTLASTSQQIADNAFALLGASAVPADAASKIPAPAVMIALGLLSGLLAGFTINGLFAFGEEYGWRGWLMNELRPLGAVKANLLIGTMWGLWHAPIIVLGFNYGAHRFAGPFFMALFCVPMSFLFWRAREFTGSLLAPALMHGALNGSAGFFLFLVGGGSELVKPPVGAVSALSFAIVAPAAWFATRGHLRDTIEPESAPPELVERSNPRTAAL